MNLAIKIFVSFISDLMCKLFEIHSQKQHINGTTLRYKLMMSALYNVLHPFATVAAKPKLLFFAFKC